MNKVTKKGVLLMTWNIRGLGNRDKRNAMFRYFERLQPQIICLQETHLQPDSIHRLSSRKYSRQYHSTYSSYSRGVSVMVSANVLFECIQQQVDEEGRYVFLLCKLNKLTCIIAAIYIPPPFSVVPLRRLAQFMALYPDIPVLALGDFNNILDYGLDRMSLIPKATGQMVGKTTFALLLSEVGLYDVWRERHGDERCYSCHSASHGGLSRIDLGLGSEALMHRVRDSAYEPRVLSDHSPFWVRLDATVATGRSLWKVNPFWLTLLPSPDGTVGLLQEYWQLNRGTAGAGVVWDTLKAFLRGCLIKEISGIKTRSREWEDKVRDEMKSREQALVVDPS